MKEVLYKVLSENGAAYHGGMSKWNLPRDGRPGDWMPPIKGELVACENGYHLCCISDLTMWLGPAIFEAEYRGERLDCDKVVVREARLLCKISRWNKRTARLFACDCAERVLGIFERENPDDDRPRRAIETARHFANGGATRQELAAAGTAARIAGAAARDAARDVAWVAGAAARDAKAAAWVAWAAAGAAVGAAAWSTTRMAVGIAAKDAAEVTAGAAEQRWQHERLLQYLNGEL